METLRRGLAVVVALAAVNGAPAVAHAASCPTPELTQTFLPWLDAAWYRLTPDGGFERGATAWTLAGGAATVQGNEPYYVGSTTDHRSLALPLGSVAVSPPVCIDVDHPTVRFFVRNTGSAASLLAVSVVFHALDGTLSSLKTGEIIGGAQWGPTPVVPVLANLLSLAGDQQVAFSFAPVDAGGSWQIDDVYVDPYGKR